MQESLRGYDVYTYTYKFLLTPCHYISGELFAMLLGVLEERIESANAHFNYVHS
jgi:hypothetical protein